MSTWVKISYQIWFVLTILVTQPQAATPTGTDGSATLTEEATYTFSMADFGFSDPGDSPPHSFSRVRISTIPALGTLKVNGAAVGGVTDVALGVPPTTTWSARESNRAWNSIASSADGTKLVAVHYGGLIYTSTDSGVNWTGRASARNWRAVASSSDGTLLTAVVQSGQIYTSADSGVTWIARNSARTWTAVAMSADGTKQLAAVGYPGGQLYKSVDSGATWAAVETTRYWTSVASSADGSKLVACAQGGQIYTSTDTGSTWTARETDRDWYGVTSSADGTRLAALGYGAPIYLSTDSGSTWTPSETSRDWYAISASADGTKMIAGAIGGKLYVTSSAGLGWTAMESNRTWAGVTMSANGNLMAAAATGAQIYTAAITNPPVLTYTPLVNGAGTPYTTFTFQVEDSGPTGSKLDPTPNTFSLNVTAVNDAPSVANPIPLQGLSGPDQIYFQFDSNAFRDPDFGDVLTYTAELESGSPLPEWLSFNSGTRTFSGTAGVGTLGPFAIRVTASDGGTPSLSTSTIIQIAIVHPPQGGNGQVSVTEDQPYVFTPSDFGFSDPYDTPPHQLMRIKLNSIPAQGTLSMNGVALQAGDYAWFSPYPKVVGASRTWSGIACSASGQSLVACVKNGLIYASSDAGGTWLADSVVADWKAVATSYYGYALVVAPLSARFSSDSGWINGSGNFDWNSIASTYLGDTFIAGATDGLYKGRIGSSVLSWSKLLSAKVIAVESNINAAMLVACVGGPGETGPIYVSVDYGVTWTARADVLRWAAVAMSQAGRTLVALPYNGPAYTSTDYGVSWTAHGVSRNWQAVAASDDGAKLIACETTGHIFTSEDYGVTWSERGPSGFWSGVAISSDGSQRFAASSNGPIYVYNMVPVFTYSPPAHSIGNAFASFTFQVEDDGPASSLALSSNTLSINIANVNDRPTVAQQIPTQFARHGVPFNFQFSADTFADIDEGTVFSYVASKLFSEPLPTWLQFDPVERRFHGTPRAVDIDGWFEVDVTATDNGSPPERVTETFRLNFTESAAPIGTPGMVTAQEDTDLVLSPSDFGFTDPNDLPPNNFTSVTISSLPTAGQLKLDGQPLTSPGARIPMRAGVGLTWTSTVMQNFGDATVIATSADGMKLAVGTGSGIQLSSDGGVTWATRGPAGNCPAICISADGTRLAACLAGGQIQISGDAGETWTARGATALWKSIAASTDGQRLVAASDAQVHTSTDGGLTWSVRLSLGSLKAVASSADGMKLAAIAGTAGYIHLSTDAGGTWNYRFIVSNLWSIASSADGTRLVACDETGSIYVSKNSGSNWTKKASLGYKPAVVMTPDGLGILAGGGSSNSTFCSLNGGDSWFWCPSLTNLKGICYTADGTRAYAVGTNKLAISVSGLPVLTYRGRANEFGANHASFTFQVEDDGYYRNLDYDRLLTLNVENTHDAPTFANWIPGQTVQQNSLFNWRIPTNTFIATDPGAAISYSVVRPDGLPLPAWLNFNPATATFTGTPKHEDIGTINLRVTQSDDGIPPQTATSNTFSFFIPSFRPEGTNATRTTTEDTPYTFSPADFGFIDAESPPDTFLGITIPSVSNGNLTFQGQAVQPWTLYAADQLSNLVYTPYPNEFGSAVANFTFKVWDSGMYNYSEDLSPNTITMNVTPVIDPPWVVVPIFSQTAPPNQLFTLTLPATTFGHDNSAVALTYTARTTAGGALPSWLTFNSSTRTFSGTPPTGVASFLDVMLTATEAGSPALSVSTSFRINSSTGKPVGIDAGVTLGQNTAYTLTAANFQFSDPLDTPANSLNRVKIHELPGVGVLKVGNRTVTAGEYVSFTEPQAPSNWVGVGPSANWRGIDCSSDGSTQIACHYGGRLYISKDWGNTWQPKAHVDDWYAACISADGRKMTAVSAGGQIYTSPDYGESWIARASVNNWRTVSSSADGTKLVAAAYGGWLHTSTNSGVTWTSRDISRYWFDVCSSADGVRLAATVYGGSIYTSSDSGGTWTPRFQTGNWRSVASSADGRKLIACLAYGALYTSTDFGVTWTSRATNQYWVDVASSADGTKLMATVGKNNPGEIYYSSDSGQTWASNSRIKPWYAINCSSDGIRLVATALYDNIYTANASPEPLRYYPQTDGHGQSYASLRFGIEDDGSAGANLDLTPNTITFNVIQSPFQIWAAQNGLPSDPKANAGANLLRFAFGLSADGSGGAGEILLGAAGITQRGAPAVGSASTPNGVDFTAVFGRRKEAGLSYAVQFSADLDAWENSPVTPTVLADDGMVEACSVPYPALLGDGRAPRFFRVSVTH
jgi:hypothetical protein